MSINIPSKWGFCDDVFIVPIKVQDSYFTAVMDAPDDWGNALIVSGFRKTNEGWIKKGLANEHELSYLSAKVSVEDVDTSFFDNYFNPVDDVLAELAVPDEVARAIEWLGVQGRKALSFEFSLVYSDLPDIALSGYLEDAVAGVSNSDTDIVYELAVERIKALTGGELSESVVEFAKEKNISLVVQPDSVLGPRGSVLLQRGERVSWKDDSGAEIAGRVSRPLLVGDEGCWLYSLPVVWVGGYPSPNEMWVSAKALGLTIEPSAAETASDQLSYDSAVSFLSGIKRLDVEALGERIFAKLEPKPNAYGGVTQHDAWIANGKLWGEPLWADNNGVQIRIMELDEQVLGLGEHDRELIRDLSAALDVISQREFGSESFERTSLCFKGVPGDASETKTYFQYNLSALFPVDQPYMQVHATRQRGYEAVAVQLGDDTSAASAEEQSCFDCLAYYHESLVTKTAAAMSYAPKENGGAVVPAVSLINTIDSVVDRYSGFDLFKDRIIELGLENSISPDFVHRLVGFNRDYITRSLSNVTPERVANILSYPHPELYDRVRGQAGTVSERHKGFAIWRNLIHNPVLDVEAVSRLVRNDYAETGLRHDYYAVSGPAYGPTNEVVQSAIKEAGVGKIYDFNGSFSFGLIKTDAVFKAGFDHLQEDAIKCGEMLKALGNFDKRAYSDALSDGFSQEAFDKWQEFSSRLSDVMRLGAVMDKARTLDRAVLESVINAEVTRQWGPFFDKGGYTASTTDRIKASAVNHVLEAIESKKRSGISFSDSGADAFIFRITKSRSRLMWSKLDVDTLSEKDARADWMKEPRGVMLDYAYTTAYGNKRGGNKLVIDLLSLTDPELAGRLYSIGDNQDQEVAVDVKPDEAGHQDTGVVTGYAIKDLRAMSIDALLTATGNMSSTQREKYVKKDLYFPRIPMADLKLKGCTPAMAAFLDQAWVLLPSKPYSMMTQDVEDYGRLISGAKDAFADLFESEVDLELGVTLDFVREWDESMMRTALPVLSSMDRDRRRFYRKGSDFNNIYMVSAFGLSEHASHHEDNYKYISQIFMDRFSVRKGGEKIRGRNLEWSHLLPVKAKAETKTVTKKIINPDIRTGEDYRKGKVLDSEDFIKTFGFSGVEFGNWTNQAEREAHINLSYDSMLDFSKVLSCEPMALSLGGRLGLCFGSRGKGGKNPASAHYEPSNMAINLTRRAGAGSLAHEYFHAIAGHYGEVESGIKGSDYSEKVGNMVIGGDENLSATPLLRKDMQEAFYNLMRAIISQPANDDDDVNDISNYTKKSPMYVQSLEQDGKGSGKKYWSQPYEMFARSMEVWTGVELARNGARNDYLVGAGKLKHDSPIYPDAEHIKRISIFADKWVAALRTELKQVQHPYLGEVQMPIFHSKNRVCQPLNKHTLESFALKEMAVLFGKVQPELAFNNRPDSASAGTYDFVKNLMVLNLSHANKDTFYHEAWHVCHSTMLNNDERHFLSDTFEQDAVKTLISDAMKENGYTDDAIKDAVSSPLELQAYAFELWVAGKVALNEKRTETVFGEVREVVDSAAGISDSFTLKGVETLFERFYGGELALEKDLELSVSADASQYDISECFGGQAGSVVYAPLPAVRHKGMGM